MACCQEVGPSLVVYFFLILKSKFSVNMEHFIGVILKLLIKHKLIHTELRDFFLRKKSVIHSCQANDHFGLTCT